MAITQVDMQVLAALARYYVLTREQIQRICFPEHQSGRSTRKHLTRLRTAGFIAKHRVPVALPGTNGAAPVYYPTNEGAEALASYFDDARFLATNTRHPRADRLAHWIALNDTRLVINLAVGNSTSVQLDGWFSEWETINKDAAEPNRFYLHVQFTTDPPLSCSPDAAFLLSAGGFKKVYYLEQDLGTSSPKQIAARKTKGYAQLAARQHHRVHFPATNVDRFAVLMVTTNRYRCEAIAAAVAKEPGAALWLFINQQELTAESFLHAPITYDCRGVAGPLVAPTANPPAASAQPSGVGS